MCTYLVNTAAVSGSGRRSDEWFSLREAVVSFDHPQDAPVDHALCVDFRGTDTECVAVELDAASARRLAQTILAMLDRPEVIEVAAEVAPATVASVASADLTILGGYR